MSVSVTLIDSRTTKPSEKDNAWDKDSPLCTRMTLRDSGLSTKSAKVFNAERRNCGIGGRCELGD